MALTVNQKKAVFEADGNVLINAGAGSGKTTAFTARIKYLVENQGVDPESILAITFTNEAVDNMRDKLVKLIGKRRAKLINITTFHALAYKTLRSEYYMEYKDKTLMQQWWKMQKLYDIIGEPSNFNHDGLNLLDGNGTKINAGDLGQFISYQKSNMIKPESAILIDSHTPLGNVLSRTELQDAYDLYSDKVKHAKLIEFDDMLMNFYYKLKDDEMLLKRMTDRYKWIMVDEMQDTNTVNMEILRALSVENLYAVGDFRQGIYGFINANIDNILTFQDEFEDVKLIQFRENFRSTKTIVDFCNKIIDVSPVELYKKFDNQVAARKEVGEPVKIRYYQNDVDEVADIIDEISSNGEAKYSGTAIICRTNSQLGQFELGLSDYDIPFDVSSARSFFDRGEIADLLAYARHTLDPEDDMSLRRVINKPSRYISNKSISDLDKYAFDNNIILEEAIGEYDIGKMNGKLIGLKFLFEDLRELEKQNASRFLKRVYSETGYSRHIKSSSKSSSEIINKEEAVERLFHMAKKFPNIKAFLGHVNKVMLNNSKPKENAVKLMTVHSSKGLEFDTVYGAGVTADTFPHEMNPDFEEERRLFYVLSSRAKNNLIISSYVYGSSGNEGIMPSPFMEDALGDCVMKLRKDARDIRDKHELLITSDDL